MQGSNRIFYDIGLDNDSLIADSNKSKKLISSIADSAERDGNRMTETFRTVAQSVGIAFSVNQVKNFVVSIAEVRGEFQQLEVAYTTMLGSKQKADALMAQTIDFAAKTPFDLQGVANGAKQLLAYGSASETVISELGMLGNVASGLSIPLNDIVYLYGTTRTQGRLFTRDLQQFMGRGIPLADELAKQFGVTKDKVGDLVTAGKVGFADVEIAMRSLTAEGGMFYNLIEEQSKTITGKMFNLGDGISQMFNKIGMANEDAISGGLDRVIDLVDNYEEVGKVLAELIATYGIYKATVITLTTVNTVANTVAVYDLATKQLNTVATMNHTRALVMQKLAQLQANAAALANPYTLIAVALAGLTYGIYKYTTSLSDAEKAQEKMNENFEASKVSIRKEEMALNDLVGRLKNAKQGTDEYKDVKGKIILQFGEYMSGLEKEKLALNNIEGAYDGIIAKMQQKYTEEAINRSISEASGDYVDRELENLNAIKENFIEKYGDKNGRELFFTILPKIKNGDKLEGEYKKIVDKFNDRQFVPNSKHSSTVTEIVENTVAYKIEQITAAQKVLEQVKKEARNKAELATGRDSNAPEKKEVESLRSRASVLKEIATVEASIKALQNKSKTGLTEKETASLVEQNKELNELKNTLSTMTGEKKTSSTKTKKTPEIYNQLAVDKENNRKLEDAVYDSEVKKLQIQTDSYEKSLSLLELDGQRKIEILKRQKADALLYLNAEQKESKTKNPKGYNASEWESKKQGFSNTFDEMISSQTVLNQNEQSKILEEKYKKDLENYSQYINDYAEKTKQFEAQLKSLKEQGFSDEVIAKAKAIQDETLSSLDEEMAIKEEAIISIAEEMVTLGVSEVLKQLESARKSLKEELNNPDADKNKIIELKASIVALNKQMDSLAGNTPKKVASKGDDWKKTVTALKEIKEGANDAIESFDMLSDSTKEVFKSVFSIASSSISMINGITKLSQSSSVAISATAKASAEAVKGVEKASIILAVISAALQVITAVVRLIGGAKDKKKEREISKIQDQVDALQKSYDALGKSIEKAYATDATKLIEQQDANLKAQKILLEKQIKAEKEKKKTDNNKVKQWQDAIYQIDQSLADSEERQIEAINGKSVTDAISDFADAYIDAWSAGEDKASAMKDVVKNMVRSAVSELVKGRLSGEVEAFSKYLSSAMEDGILDGAEKSILDTLQSSIETKLSTLSSTLDEYLVDNTEDETRTSSEKGFANMSQDSADELNGRFATLQAHTFSINESIKQLQASSAIQLKILAGIEVNTSNLFRLEKIEELIGRMKYSIDDINEKGIIIRR